MRPSKYSNELAERFCLELINGKSVRQICKGKDYPSTVTIFSWLNKNQEFLNQYEKAKAIQAELMAEDMISIADNESGEVQRDRLRIDARKWVVSKLLPKKYGQANQAEEETNKVTVVELKRDFSEPIDFDGLSDQEILRVARETNKKAVIDYNND